MRSRLFRMDQDRRLPLVLQAEGSPKGCPLDAAAAKKNHKKRVSQGPIDTYLGKQAAHRQVGQG